MVGEAPKSQPAEELKVLTGVPTIEATLVAVSAGDVGLRRYMIACLYRPHCGPTATTVPPNS